MSRPRVVIEVSGGCLNTVFSSEPVDVLIVDYDNKHDMDEDEWLNDQGWQGADGPISKIIDEDLLAVLSAVGEPGE